MITTAYKRMDGAKPTILIADDDTRNIFALKAVLTLKGYQVVTAYDGKECLAVLESNPAIDIVLLDMMMPEMDGYETLQILRRQEQFKHLPILAVTAQAMTGDREKCLDAGATDYISKPIDDEKLLLLINQYVRR